MDAMYKKKYRDSVKFASSSAGLENYSLKWWIHNARHWPIYPLLLEETKRNQARPNFKMVHTWLLLCQIIDGSQNYKFNRDQSFCVQKDELCIIPPQYKYQCYSNEGYHKLVIMIDGELIKENCNILGIDKPIHMPPNSLKFFNDLKDLMNSESYEISEARAITDKVLTELSIYYSSMNKNDEHKLLAEIKIALGHNLDQNISLDEVASNFSISKSYLQKLFQRNTSISPMQYRINQKMERARYFLRHTEQSVKEIAALLGYNNQHYFAYDFKKHHGSTPSEYRKVM